MLTGDPRRWGAEPGMPGVVHVLDPYHGIERGWDTAEQSLAMLDEVIQLEGPHTIAGFILETMTGTNGVLIPPDGYLQGVRELCTKHGILMICDEVMAGFGRTGEWFAVDHWNVVPDIITMAKGLTEAYVQLGAVGHAAADRGSFQGQGVLRRAHLQQPSAGLRGGAGDDPGLRRGQAARQRAPDGRGDEGAARGSRRAASVGRRGAIIGLFGLVELVRDRAKKEPLAPFNGTSEEMAALSKFFRQEGLYTFVRWNTFFTNPPLCITEAELREAFAIIDRGLEITDRAVK